MGYFHWFWTLLRPNTFISGGFHRRFYRCSHQKCPSKNRVLLEKLSIFLATCFSFAASFPRRFLLQSANNAVKEEFGAELSPVA